MTTDPCCSYREQLSAWIDGDLSPDAARKMSAHLEACASCRLDVDLLKTAIGALQRFPAPPEPTGVLAGLRKRLTPEPWYRRILHPKGEGWVFGVPVGALATILVIVGVAFFQARFPGIEHKHAAPADVRSVEEGPHSSNYPDSVAVSDRHPGEKGLTLGEPSPSPPSTQDAGIATLGTKPEVRVLSLLVERESDVGELRKAIENREGVILEATRLDEQALRGIVSSSSLSVPDAGWIRIGWKLEVRLPSARLTPLVEEIGRRPGHQFLTSKTVGAATEISANMQDVRIFVFLR